MARWLRLVVVLGAGLVAAGTAGALRWRVQLPAGLEEDFPEGQGNPLQVRGHPLDVRPSGEPGRAHSPFISRYSQPRALAQSNTRSKRAFEISESSSLSKK